MRLQSAAPGPASDERSALRHWRFIFFGAIGLGSLKQNPNFTNPYRNMQAFGIIGLVFGIVALSLASSANKAVKQQQAEISALKASVDDLRARLGSK